MSSLDAHLHLLFLLFTYIDSCYESEDETVLRKEGFGALTVEWGE